jgi:hypothetical protein
MFSNVFSFVNSTTFAKRKKGLARLKDTFCYLDIFPNLVAFRFPPSCFYPILFQILLSA